MELNIKDYLETITEFPHRSDCPNCGNRNTFSVDIVDDCIAYHCFHINCNIKGRIKHALGIEAIIHTNGPNVFSEHMGKNSGGKVWQGDASFTNPLQHRGCFAFIKRWGLDIPYMERRIGLKYDPKQNRCVFEIRDSEGSSQGATGRALGVCKMSKWFIYERLYGCPGFILCPRRYSRGLLILVEDMISACKVSEVCDAAALLGTNISPETITHLLPFKELVIALDQDATQKALKLQQELSAYRPTKVLPLIEDLKYLTKEQIKDKLDEIS